MVWIEQPWHLSSDLHIIPSPHTPKMLSDPPQRSPGPFAQILRLHLSLASPQMQISFGSASHSSLVEHWVHIQDSVIAMPFTPKPSDSVSVIVRIIITLVCIVWGRWQKFVVRFVKTALVMARSTLQISDGESPEIKPCRPIVTSS